MDFFASLNCCCGASNVEKSEFNLKDEFSKRTESKYLNRKASSNCRDEDRANYGKVIYNFRKIIFITRKQ